MLIVRNLNDWCGLLAGGTVAFETTGATIAHDPQVIRSYLGP